MHECDVSEGLMFNSVWPRPHVATFLLLAQGLKKRKWLVQRTMRCLLSMQDAN
jgi:hypothetical protein